MGTEIERKFLVTTDAWRAAAHAVVPMAQGYLNDAASIGCTEYASITRMARPSVFS